MWRPESRGAKPQAIRTHQKIQGGKLPLRKFSGKLTNMKKSAPATSRKCLKRLFPTAYPFPAISCNTIQYCFNLSNNCLIMACTWHARTHTDIWYIYIWFYMILYDIICIFWHSVRGELLGWRWSKPECWSLPGSRNWWCKISSAPLLGLTLRYGGTRMLMTAWQIWQIYSQLDSLPPRGSTWQLQSLQSPRHWFADFHCYWLPAANWKSKCWCLLCTVYAHGSLQLYCVCPDCPDTQHCRNIESGGIT